MIDKKRLFAGLLAALLLASGFPGAPLPAQEVAENEAQEADETIAADAQTDTSEQQKTETPGAGRDDTFVPTEKVSSDNSISFPVDI